MATYSTPGAYIEWQDASRPVIDPLRTDIAGFVGLAERGPLDTPVPVESIRQFEAHFGSFIGGGFLAYAVRGFFENGGQRCWIVRVAAASGGRPAAAATATLAAAAVPRWQITASSPGVWGDGITATINVLAPARTVTAAGPASTRFITVASVANIQRADLLSLTQPGLTAPLYRVVSAVDATTRRLYFVNPDPRQALPYDRPLEGYDHDQPLQVQSIAYAIAVAEDGWPVAFYPLLAPIPEHPSYAAQLLAPPTYPLVIPPGGSLPAPPPPIVISELAETPYALSTPLDVTQGQVVPLSGGADGLADLIVDDYVGSPVLDTDSDVERRARLRGLRAIDQVDEVALVAAPDVVIQPEQPPVYGAVPPAGDPCLACPPPAPPRLVHQPVASTEMPPLFSDDEVFLIQSTLVQLCEERNDRFALLDPTCAMAEDTAQGMALVSQWRSRFETDHAALYFPWLEVVDPLDVAPTRRVPPSGHVAGLCAQLDLEVGVHRAPANRVLSWAEDASLPIDDARHGELNSLNVNVIRTQPGLDLRVLGARTLSSDPSWRFINVRRLVMMVMKAIDISSQWAVFEPNDAATRTRLGQTLSEFFQQLWQRGALVGTTPAQAFAVRCDEVNNPPDLRADGELIADVAIAPSQPFEYVVLRLGRQSNAFEVVQQGTVRGSSS